MIYETVIMLATGQCLTFNTYNPSVVDSVTVCVQLVFVTMKGTFSWSYFRY
jgi:hypothetical protein